MNFFQSTQKEIKQELILGLFKVIDTLPYILQQKIGDNSLGTRTQEQMENSISAFSSFLMFLFGKSSLLLCVHVFLYIIHSEDQKIHFTWKLHL